MGSNNVLRRTYIANLVRQGDLQQAIDFYTAQYPGAFSTPIDLGASSIRRSEHLLEIAQLLLMQDPASTRAAELIDAVETEMLSIDERFIPWQRAMDRAAIATIHNNRQLALEQLQRAFELGMRSRWRNLLLSNIVFNSLHEEPEFKRLVAMLEEDMQRQREEAYKIPGVLK